MRAARPALVTLIGVAAVLLAAAPSFAATGAKMALSASHGAAGESVTATFSYPGHWGLFGPNCDDPVTFRWDGRSIAQARPGWSGGTCSASVTITPPASASGSHVVKGSAPNAGSAEATYTIDPAPAPVASPASPPQAAPPQPATTPPVRALDAPQSPSPSRSGRSAQPSRSAVPTPSAGPSSAAGAVPAPSVSASTGEPATLVTLDAPTVVVRPAVTTPLGVWVLMAGGALVLLGAGLVGAGRLFRRRRRVAFSI
ncbi:hypothetical protein HC028_04790 [Planosporangium flavigriseum]|uniref:LPXTG-motif cell wall anchor domain-containing protein n=1 Tax=Planosporangium flavigriseum TaxID=373681 RepID=A0A8J3LUT3_9ACTN|nr:hypothetical protein [Planosporangium flavigriseum]NJC63826.1 hypothetical protein [Planosporangium flavigriseum]GIG73675.1 hypothetical protein Pfl04_20790 [Planosporangium flavigriseum]